MLLIDVRLGARLIVLENPTRVTDNVDESPVASAAEMEIPLPPSSAVAPRAKRRTKENCIRKSFSQKFGKLRPIVPSHV